MNINKHSLSMPFAAPATLIHNGAARLIRFAYVMCDFHLAVYYFLSSPFSAAQIRDVVINGVGNKLHSKDSCLMSTHIECALCAPVVINMFAMHENTHVCVEMCKQ